MLDVNSREFAPFQMEDSTLVSVLDTKVVCLRIPEGVTKIKSRAMSHCRKLKTVYLPESLTRITLGSFLDCTNLKAIHLPKSLQSIEQYAFKNCSSLVEIYGGNGSVYRQCYEFHDIHKFDYIDPKFLPSFPEEEQLEYLIKRWEHLKPRKQKAAFSYVKRNFPLSEEFFHSENLDLLSALLQEKTRVPLFFLYEHLDYATKKKNTQEIAMYLRYIHESYNEKEREAYEERKYRIEMGQELPIYEEFCKKWRCSKKSPEIKVHEYLGTASREVIPKILADGCQVRMMYNMGNEPEDRGLRELVIEADLREYPSNILPQTLESLIFLGTCDDFVFRIQDLERLVLPRSKNKDSFCLQARLFEHCPNLKDITIPDDDTEIEEGCFDQFKNLIVRGSKGSYAETYCKKYGIEFIQT